MKSRTLLLKRHLSILTALLLIVTQCSFFIQQSVRAAEPLNRAIHADWDTVSPTVPTGTEVKVPYADYESGNAWVTVAGKEVSFASNIAAQGNTMLAVRVKSGKSAETAGADWMNIFLRTTGVSCSYAFKAGRTVTYIPVDGMNLKSKNSSYTEISTGIYTRNDNQSMRFEYGFNGWIILSLSDCNTNSWNSYADVEAILAEKINTLFINGISADTVVDEIQTFKGTASDFYDAFVNKTPTGECEHKTYSKVSASPATCKDAGNIEHWKCNNCGGLFADEACKNPLTASQVTIPATGIHEYEDGKCKWCQKAESKPDPVVESGKGSLLSDWDTVFPKSAPGETISGVSGYGTALKFDNDSHLMQFSDDVRPKATDNAIAFYMIMPRGTSQSFRFFVREQNEGSVYGEAYQLKNRGQIYLIDTEGNVSPKSYNSNDESITISGGYLGWIVIPFSSLELHKSYGLQDGILSPEKINRVNYWGFTGVGPYYLDQYYTLNTDDIEAFAVACNQNREDVGEPPEEEKPPTELDSSDDINRTGVLCNFDDVNYTSLTNNANITVAVKSDEGFEENYLEWTNNNPTSPFKISFKAAARTFDTAITFRLSVPENKIANLLIGLHDTQKEGKTELYQLKSNTIIYTIDESGHFRESVVNTLTLDGGFNGWVIVPFSSLERNRGWSKYNDVLNIESITAIQFWSNVGDTGPLCIDSITTIKDIFEFAEQNSDYIPPLPNDVILNDFEKGIITGDLTVENWTAYANSANAIIAADADNSLDGSVALNAKANATAEVRIKNELSNEDLLQAVSYRSIGMWISNTSDSALELDIGLTTKDGTITLKPDDMRSDFYRLVDGESGKTTAIVPKNNKLSIPADFSGYLIWSVTAYEKIIDIKSLTEIVLKAPAGSSFIVDNISIINDVDKYVSATLNCKPDSDFILSIGDGVEIVGSDISFKDSNVSSTVFRNNIAIRRGYYIVMNDGDDNQTFGHLKSMSNTKTVSVFLSGTKLKTYNVTTFVSSEKTEEGEPTAPNDNKENTGSQNNTSTSNTTGKSVLTDNLTGIALRYNSGSPFAKDDTISVEPLPNKELPTDVYKYFKSKRYLPYRVAIKNSNVEQIITEVVKLTIPVADCFEADKCKVYRLTEDDWLEDMEAVIENGELVIYTENLGTFIVFQEADSNIGNMATIYGVDVDEGMPETSRRETQKHTGTRVIKGEIPWVWIIIGVASAVVVAGGITLFIIIRKRKKS